jgi:hypothetical protein
MGRIKELLYLTSGEAQFDMADHGDDPRSETSEGNSADADRSVSPPPERVRESRRSKSA